MPITEVLARIKKRYDEIAGQEELQDAFRKGSLQGIEKGAQNALATFSDYIPEELQFEYLKGLSLNQN